MLISQARAVAEKMGMAEAEVGLDVVKIKKRKQWNGSTFDDIEIQQG